MTEEEKMQIVDRVLTTIKYAKEKEWYIFYEYVTNLQTDLEEKRREVEQLNQEIRNLNDDIAENYKPIPRAEQYDMGEHNFH